MSWPVIAALTLATVGATTALVGGRMLRSGTRLALDTDGVPYFIRGNPRRARLGQVLCNVGIVASLAATFVGTFGPR